MIVNKVKKNEVINNINHTVVENFVNNKLVSTEWYVDNKKHREDDLPAQIYVNGTKKWYFNDFLHRENKLPAIESPKENKFFLLGIEVQPYELENLIVNKKVDVKNNIIEYRDSLDNYYYSINNLLQSVDDKPAIIIRDYEEQWFKDGLLHRDNDKPAISSEVDRQWLQNGKYHRDLRKPAFISVEEGMEFWFEGEYYSKEEVESYFIKKKIEGF
jgi:hypothetical protein